jgi:hypothetical protein
MIGILLEPQGFGNTAKSVSDHGVIITNSATAHMQTKKTQLGN